MIFDISQSHNRVLYGIIGTGRDIKEMYMSRMEKEHAERELIDLKNDLSCKNIELARSVSPTLNLTVVVFTSSHNIPAAF
jgi:hypothetical protein